ncbi:hypothetical protein JCM31185_10690 [Furfurilactobacillus curtus]|uniref:Uncharacterized protein n=1 Tax=Furfurilactobacillus curtus TaxID=1746200 RepID=A0ABQ5JMP5_9LACO
MNSGSWLMVNLREYVFINYDTVADKKASKGRYARGNAVKRALFRK